MKGIGCGGCLASVREILEAHPNIEKTEIFLAPKGVNIITVKEALTSGELQNQLNEQYGYPTAEIN